MNTVAEMPPRMNETAARGSRPTVVFVTPHKATYFKPLYEAFARSQPEGWSTVIVWPEGHRSEHPVELLTPVAANLEICNVVAREIRRKFLPGADLLRTLEECRPRLIVIQEYSPFSLGALRFARKRRIPVVVLTEVGRRNRHFFSRRAQGWHAFWSRFVDGIAAACPAAHEPLSGGFLPSVATYHAMDARSFEPLPRKHTGPVTFAYLGQLIPRKGLDLWLEAARLLLAAGHGNFKLRIIGGGDENWVRGLAQAAGLADKMEWRGFLSGAALREALGTSDVFVLPTRQDTYAAVVHEAACLGLPLLVSGHAGAAEALVRDGENGFVVNPADARDFAQRMRFLLDARLRARLGAVSREVAEEFSAHRRGAALSHWMEEHFLNASCNTGR
jgi:glycosyltransferase involved in cell wall biosynthesis